MEINTYGTIMFLLGSVVGAVVKTFIEFGIRQHFERKAKARRKAKKAAKKKKAALLDAATAQTSEQP